MNRKSERSTPTRSPLDSGVITPKGSDKFKGSIKIKYDGQEDLLRINEELRSQSSRRSPKVEQPSNLDFKFNLVTRQVEDIGSPIEA